jgi:hypothetical protein
MIELLTVLLYLMIMEKVITIIVIPMFIGYVISELKTLKEKSNG